MLSLPLKVLRSAAKNRNIDGYKSMPKDKLLRIINNNKKKIRNSIFKLKKRGNKKSMNQQKRLKRVFTCQHKKKPFRAKIKEIIYFRYDLKIKRNRMIKEIEKILYDSKN